MPSQCLVAMRLRQTNIQHSLGYGARILFVERPLKMLDNLPEPTRASVRAFHALKPHRVTVPESLTFDQIMGGSLFHNGQILKHGRPLHHDFVPLCMYMYHTAAPSVGPGTAGPCVCVEICLGQQIVYGLANLDVLWMSPWTCRKYVTTLDIWMCD